MRETAIIESDCCLYYNFFFSSRRRQTRWPRDWSSDVCSSDLCQRQDEPSAPPGIPRCVPSVGSTLNGRRLYGTEIGSASCRERVSQRLGVQPVHGLHVAVDDAVTVRLLYPMAHTAHDPATLCT